MNCRLRLVAVLAGIVFGFVPGGARAQTYELNHIHKTASIFMDTDEMHKVALQILSDSLRLSYAYSFKSKDGSRTLHCALPSSILLERIVRVDVKARSTFWSGGGRVHELQIDVLDEGNKTQTYTFVSSTAVHRSKQSGGYWQEGADRGRTVEMVGKVLDGAVQASKASLTTRRLGGQSENTATPPKTDVTTRTSPADRVSSGSSGSASMIGQELGQDVPPQLIEQSGHASSVDALVVTPDGKWLLSAGHDFSVRLWDLEQRREVRILGHHLREVNTLALSPDGHWLVSGSNDQTLKLWELPSGRFVRDFTGHTESVKAAAFAPDGRWFVSAGGDPPSFEGRKPDYSLRIWDTKTGREIRRLQGHEKLVESVDVSKDGSSITSASFDGTIKIWDSHTGRLLRTINDFGGPVSASFFSSNASSVVSASMGRIELWDVDTGRKLTTLAQNARPYRMAFNPKRPEIAYPSEGTVKLFDLTEQRLLGDLTSSERMVESIAFSPDGTLLISGYSSGGIDLWNAQSHKRLAELSGFAARIDSVAVSADGALIASGNRDATIRIWNAQNGRLTGTLKSENREIQALAFSPNGRWIASAGQRYTTAAEMPVEVWDLADGQRIRRFCCEARKIEFLSFSPSGRWVAAGISDGTVKLWDTASQRSALVLSPANKAVAFAPDESWVATGSRDNALSYWQLPGGRLLHKLPNIGWAYAISPNGRWLASMGWQNDFKVWDIDVVTDWTKRHANDRGVIFSLDLGTRRKQRTFRGHTQLVTDVAFSPDGRVIASASWDGDIKLWGVETGRELRTLSGHTSGVESIRFTPSGKQLLSAGWDGTLRVWDVETGIESVALIAANASEDWLVVAPNGLFDGTADAMRQVAWRTGNDNGSVPLDTFFTDFYSPGLLAEIMSGQRPKARIDIATAVKVPGLRTMLTEKLAHLENHEGRLVVCFEHKPGAVLNVSQTDQRIYFPPVNGYEAGTTPTCKFEKQLATRGPTTTAAMESLQNRNREQIVTPWDGNSSETAHSTLHVLTVAVSQYPQSSGFDSLPYAVSSAKDIDAFFRDQQRSDAKPYADVRIWDALYDSAATRAAFRLRLLNMAKEVTADDVVLIYLAGHGRVNLDSEMFYFVPVDGVSGKLDDTGLSTAIIAEALRTLPARRIVLIVDACQSGGAVEALSKVAMVKAQSAERGAQQRRYTTGGADGVGMYLIAATLPLSYAVGLPHGESALAQTLLTCLRGAQSEITARSLSGDIRERLPSVSEKAAHFRQVPLIDSIGLDFAIAKSP